MTYLHPINDEMLKQMKDGKGFIAALDQSGGSTPKALKGYGVEPDMFTVNGVQDNEKMFNLIHEMRARVITSKAFDSSKIIGAILFEKTMESKIDNLGTAEYLWNKKHVVPFLKIDKGLAEKADGVKLMKPIPGLDELLERAVKHGVFGTKMRSVIDDFNPKGIKAIVDQQFELGLQIAKHGLVPILEPETTISSSDRAESEKLLHDLFVEKINALDKDVKIMIKISIPVNPHLWDDLLDNEHVVRIVALSGGFSCDEANKLLKKCPGLIASFSRALLEHLRYQQSQVEFDNNLQKAVDSIYDASVNKD